MASSYIDEWRKMETGMAIVIPGDILSRLTSPNIRILNES